MISPLLLTCGQDLWSARVGCNRFIIWWGVNPVVMCQVWATSRCLGCQPGSQWAALRCVVWRFGLRSDEGLRPSSLRFALCGSVTCGRWRLISWFWKDPAALLSRWIVVPSFWHVACCVCSKRQSFCLLFAPLVFWPPPFRLACCWLCSRRPILCRTPCLLEGGRTQRAAG